MSRSGAVYGNLVLPNPRSGWRYFNGIQPSTMIGSEGWFYCAPLFLARATPIALVEGEVTIAAGAGGTVRFGIYADDGAGYPGVLLYDSGVQDATVVSVKSVAAAFTGRPLMWAGAINQGLAAPGATVRATLGSLFAFAPLWPGASYSSALAVNIGQGALPANMPAGAVVGAIAPRIAVVPA